MIKESQGIKKKLIKCKRQTIDTDIYLPIGVMLQNHRGDELFRLTADQITECVRSVSFGFLLLLQSFFPPEVVDEMRPRWVVVIP